MHKLFPISRGVFILRNGRIFWKIFLYFHIMQLSLETKSILLSAIEKLRFSFEQMENAHELVKAIKKYPDYPVGDETTARR